MGTVGPHPWAGREGGQWRRERGRGALTPQAAPSTTPVDAHPQTYISTRRETFLGVYPSIRSTKWKDNPRRPCVSGQVREHDSAVAKTFAFCPICKPSTTVKKYLLT